MTQNTDPKTIELPGDPDMRNADLLELSRQLTELEKDVARRVAFERGCKEEMTRRNTDLQHENARLFKLAVWAAKESGEYCPDCEERARSEFDYCWEGPGKPDIDIIDDALEYDGFLEQASEYCDRPNCAGGWKAFVPETETIQRGDQSYTEPVYVPISKRGDA